MEVNKMTRKEMVMEVLGLAKNQEVNGIYEMTANEFYKIDAAIGNGDYPELKLCKNKKDSSLLSIYDKAGKTRYAIIKLVEEQKAKKAKKEKAQKKQKNNEGPTNHKEVTNFYVLKITTKEKGSRINDEIGSCETLKALIKKLRKEKIVSLEVYKMGQNYMKDKNDIIPTRRSAWV